MNNNLFSQNEGMGKPKENSEENDSHCSTSSLPSTSKNGKIPSERYLYEESGINVKMKSADAGEEKVKGNMEGTQKVKSSWITRVREGVRNFNVGLLKNTILQTCEFISTEELNNKLNIFREKVLRNCYQGGNTSNIPFVDRPFILIDVRRFDEYDFSHIESAINVHIHTTLMRRLKHRLGGIPKDKEIICYCAVGFRSGLLARKLKEKLGFKNVKVLDQGLYKWVMEKRPLVCGKTGNTTHKVIPEQFLAAQYLEPEMRHYPTKDNCQSVNGNEKKNF